MNGSEYESQLPGLIAWVRLYADPGRTVIIATEGRHVEMIRQFGDKGLIIFWHAELVR
jgi:hypothetical protein